MDFYLFTLLCGKIVKEYGILIFQNCQVIQIYFFFISSITFIKTHII